MSKHRLPLNTLRDCRSFYLKRLKEKLLTSPDLSQADIKEIARGAGEFFDEVIEQAKRGSFTDEAKGLTSSCLTLVSDEELALSIRLDNLANSLYESVSSNLWKPYRRFATLLERPDLPRYDNPVGPLGIARGLDFMFNTHPDLLGEERQEMIDRLEELLHENLPEVYSDLDNFLDETGVLAAQATILTAPGTGSNRRGDPAELMGTLAALNKALIGRLPTMGVGGAGGGAATGSTQAGVAPEKAAAPLMAGGAQKPRAQPQTRPPTFDQLCSRLNALEPRAKGDVGATGNGGQQLENLIPELFDVKADKLAKSEKLSATSLGLSALSPEGMAVDMLSAIFDAIALAHNRPEGLRHVAAMLKVTAIKEALRAPERVGESGNPWQLFLDAVAELFRSLPVDAGVAHPLLARVCAIVAQLRQEFDHKPKAFAEAQAKLEALQRERDGELQRIRESYLPLFGILEKYDWARQAALARMARVGEHALPPEFRFFRDIWLGVLEKAWLHAGPESPEWGDYSNLLEDLLWSFDAGMAAQATKERATRIPEILKRLRAGLEYAQQPAEVQAQVFQMCFALQAKAAKPQTMLPKLPLATHKASDGKEIFLRRLKFGAGRLQLIDYRTPFQPMPDELSCAIGDALMLNIGKTQHYFYLLHVATEMGRALLLPLDGEIPLVIHMGILESQLSTGRARQYLPGSFFESAAARALQGVAP